MNLYWWICGTILLWLQKRDLLIRFLWKICWLELWWCDFDSNTKYTSNWLKNGLKTFEILCSSRSLCVLCVLRAFFIVKDLWWKFFGALVAWICRASPICGFLKFLEAFELDSSELWNLGTWLGWFLFECSWYLKVCGRSPLECFGLESVELR